MPQSGAPPHQIGYKVDSVVHAIASGRNRSTVVFVDSHGQWLIAHEHYSPFPTNR